MSIEFKSNLRNPAAVTGEQRKAETAAKVRDVAEMYEKHFLRELTKSMRSTVPDSGLIKKNQGEQLFREQLDSEYVEKWGARGGIGLADMIEKQLIEKYGVQMGLREGEAPARGPLQLNEKANYVGQVRSTPEGLNYHYSPQEGVGYRVPVTMPWQGKVLSVHSDQEGQHWMNFTYLSGNELEFYLKGSLNSEFLQGPFPKDLSAGENLGYLSLENPSFQWKIR